MDGRPGVGRVRTRSMTVEHRAVLTGYSLQGGGAPLTLLREARETIGICSRRSWRWGYR